MPKAKLTVNSKDVNKLKNALELVDGEVIAEKSIGEETVCSINFKSPDSLFRAGRYMSSVTGEAPKAAAQTAKK